MKEQEYEQINHPNGVTTWKTKPKEQPEALRLADEIEWIAAGKAGKETAAEIRRLHALNQELLEALKAVVDSPDEDSDVEAYENALKVIAKAQGESNE